MTFSRKTTALVCAVQQHHASRLQKRQVPNFFQNSASLPSSTSGLQQQAGQGINEALNQFQGLSSTVYLKAVHLLTLKLYQESFRERLEH